MEQRTTITHTEPYKLTYVWTVELKCVIGTKEIFIGSLYHDDKECLLSMAKMICELPELHKQLNK
jgi:hypothetical protein